MKKLAFILLFCIPSLVFSQSVKGLWKTIDDETGKVKSIVKIYKKNNLLYGKVVEVIDKQGRETPICDKCPGDLKNEPIEGMQIINGLELKRGKWKGDDGILDPEKGKYYNCKIWPENKHKLNVRGYIGPLFRTQTWLRKD